MLLPIRQPGHKAQFRSCSKNAVRLHHPASCTGLVPVARARERAKKIWRFRPTFSVLGDWQPLLLAFSFLGELHGVSCF